MGLPIGPWLRAFKEAMLRGKSDETLIDVPGVIGTPTMPCPFPLAFSKKRSGKSPLAVRLPMSSIAPLRMRTLKRSFGSRRMRTFFLMKRHSSKLTLRSQRCVTNLTARQAGTIARLAEVKRIVTLHHSPRYKEIGNRLTEEARDAFVSD
jgi:ribonuclease Z